jgi:hypothetical protein
MTLSITTLSINYPQCKLTQPTVLFAECHVSQYFAEYRYAECGNAESQYGKSHSA